MPRTLRLLVNERSELAAQYHPDNEVPVGQITLGMNFKARWVCSCGKDWWGWLLGRINSSLSDFGCGECVKRLPAPPEKSLLLLRPELAAQYHPDNELPVEAITIKNGRDVRWVCTVCSHDWWAVVSSRVNSVAESMGCPACGGKVVTPATSLLLNYPQISAEYHRTRNTRPVEEVTSRTSTKCWWECTVDPTHEWQTSPLNRVKQGDGCPFCGGRFATPENNFGRSYPQLVPEFDLEANYPLTPADFTPRSNRKVGWKCLGPVQHKWYASIASRTQDGKMHQCSKCVRHESSPETSIIVTHPDLASEFDHEKNAVPVEKIMYGSRTKRWWCCNAGKNHPGWEATPATRTGKRPHGCPDCSPTPRTSAVEKSLREAIRTSTLLMEIPETYNAFLPIHSGRHKSMGVDIYGKYGSKKVVVEYDSWWWHTGGGRKPASESLERDIRKTEAMLAAGYLVVRVREERSDASLDFLPIVHPNLLQLHFNHLRLGYNFSGLLGSIREWLAS